MIKVLYLIPKRPDISDEQFHRHWREVHAPLALSLPGLHCYVQSHRIKHPGFGLSCPAERAAASPEFRVEQLNDAQQFVDVEHLEGFVAEENRVIWP